MPSDMANLKPGDTAYYIERGGDEVLSGTVNYFRAGGAHLTQRGCTRWVETVYGSRLDALRALKRRLQSRLRSHNRRIGKLRAEADCMEQILRQIDKEIGQ